MKRLIYAIYTHKNTLTFLLLETISLQLILSPRWRAQAEALNSAHSVVGRIYELIHPIHRPINTKLLTENALLYEQLAQINLAKDVSVINENVTRQFNIIPAQVINNSIIYSKNYLTINAGSQAGIVPGMGVFSSQGVVGIIKAVSEHFATVISLLHTDVSISAKISSTATMGTLHWLGQNPAQAQLLYIPPHIPVSIGDKVVTSGHGTAFYEGITLGTVRQVRTPSSGFFYDIVVDLSTDFSTLAYVYVINNSLKKEQDALEQSTKQSYE